MTAKRTRGDNLSDYLQTAHHNSRLMGRDSGAYFRIFASINEVFVIGEKTMNPRPESRGGPFMAAAHGSYLAAVNLGLSLHVVDAYKPLRGCLEGAMYALHVERDPAAYRRWAERPRIDDLSRDAVKRKEQISLRKKVGAEFSVTRIAQELQDSRFRSRVENLYEETIDYGGHYNFSAFQRHFEIVDFDNQQVRNNVLTGEESEFVFCFRKIAEVGIVALHVMTVAFGDQWDQQLISSRLNGIAQRLKRRHATKLRRRRT